MDKIRYDYLHYHPDYKVAQHKDMYHFNTDTCLLGEFIKINENETVLDVGTNNGALLVYICKKGGIATGIEINSEAIEICKLTLKANDINASLINKDFTLWEEDVKFDVIVSNPPYFDSTTVKQRNVNKNIEMARHEGSLNASSLCANIAKHLKANGRAYLVYRPNRLKDLEKYFNENNLYISNYQLVFDHRKSEAKSVLIEVTFEKKEKQMLDNQYI